MLELDLAMAELENRFASMASPPFRRFTGLALLYLNGRVLSHVQLFHLIVGSYLVSEASPMVQHGTVLLKVDVRAHVVLV